MLELFLAGGMDLFRAMRMLVPPAWQKNRAMDDDLRAQVEDGVIESQVTTRVAKSEL